MITDKYPEFQAFVNVLPDGTVIDGEILPYKDGRIGTFGDLQTRIGRKTITKALLQKTPVIIRAYDLLEWQEKTSGTIRMKKEGNCWKNFMMP